MEAPHDPHAAPAPHAHVDPYAAHGDPYGAHGHEEPSYEELHEAALYGNPVEQSHYHDPYAHAEPAIDHTVEFLGYQENEHTHYSPEATYAMA